MVDTRSSCPVVRLGGYRLAIGVFLACYALWASK